MWDCRGRPEQRGWAGFLLFAVEMTSPAELHYQRGLALHKASDFAGALAAYDAALTAAPQVGALHYARGNALVMLRRLEQAIEAFDRCLALEPRNPGALYNRVMALIQLQRWHDALAGLEVLVGHYPDMADAWNNRAGVMQALGRHEDALRSLEQAIRLRPQDGRALYNAGLTLLLLNRFDEAQQALSRSLEINPNHADSLGSLVSASLRACDWDTLDRLLPRLLPALRDGRITMSPLTLLALSDDPDLQRRCAESETRRSLASAGLDKAAPAPMADRPYRHDRIRIGYLSSDFRDHPVAAQLVGVLERHDRSRFEVTGLFTGRADASSKYHRIVRACDRFCDISGMGSREAAALIRELEIDILVDLNGHTLGWRPAILKYRPAPVIASFLGYAGTTGADFIDYIIGDPHVTPSTLAPALSEKIVQIPHSFWPSDPTQPEPETVSRAQAGLPADAFVFCCFNSNHKIRPDIFDIWGRLLAAVPDSVLWIRGGNAAMNARFQREAGLCGIEAERILFAGRMDSFARHLGRQQRCDLFLDTYPYNAHATASDALWAGLPIVTLRGESFVSRVTAGFLTNLGLEELIASTPAEYEAIALGLARDRARLSHIRRHLAEARKTSALFDVDRFVRGLEGAFLEMQRRAGDGPSAFRVDEASLSQSTLSI
jgi:predicted O-linked N-acetylglucosamine transferase (SPINDLY family)